MTYFLLSNYQNPLSLDGMRGRFGFGFLNYRGAPRAGFSARFLVFSGKIDVSMRGK